MATSLRDQTYYYQQSSFAGGELSPDMYGRNDFTKYSVSLSESTNMYPLPFGGVVSRAGTEFLRELTSDTTSAVQMIPFSFSSTQNIILLFVANANERKIYFLANEGIIVKDGEPYTIDHNYSEGSVGSIQYAQSADVLFLAHNTHEPMKLVRYDTYDWRLEQFSTRNGSPYGALNDTDITLQYKAPVEGTDYKAFDSTAKYACKHITGAFGSVDYEAQTTYSATFPAYKNTITVSCTGSVWSTSSHRNGYISYNGSVVVTLQKLNIVKNTWVDVKSSGNLTTGYVSGSSTPSTPTATLSYTDDNSKVTYYRVRVSCSPGVYEWSDDKRGYAVWFDTSATVHITVPEFTTSVDIEPTLIASQPLFQPSDLLRWVRIDEAVKSHEDNFRPSSATKEYTGDAIPINGQWSILMSGKFQGSFGIEVSYDNKKTWENYRLWNVKDVDTFQNSGEIEGLAYIRLVCSASEETGVVQINVDSFVNSCYAQITNVQNNTTVNVSFETHVQSKQFGIVEEFTGQYNYSFSSWTPDNGYPSAVAFFQDRLCWASTKAEPLGIWMSSVGDYYNYAVEIDQEDDEPISINLVSQSLNSVSSLLSKTDLIGFTADGAWRIGSRNQAQGLTSKTVSASQQSFEGASALKPLVINDRALYVLNQGATVRDLAYDYSSDSYMGDDLTLLSRHLFRGHSIRSWCYAQEPDSLVYAVRDDGVLLTLTYNKEQDVYAWAKHETQGSFVAVQSIRGTTRTLVYFIVERFGKLYIETLSDRLVDDTVRMNFIDCSAVYSGEEVNEISGLDFLEGATVQILADGSEQPSRVVTGGKIVLGTPASYVRVGLGYRKQIVTLNLDYPRQNGTIQGRKKSTSVVKLLLDKSYGGEVRIKDKSKRSSFLKNTLPEKYGEPLELFSGIRTVTVRGGSDINLYITAYQDSPVPFNILSIMVDIVAEE